MPHEAKGRSTARMAGGLLLGMAALFLLPATVREVASGIVRGEFIRDVLVVEEYNDGGESDPVVLGRLRSTGEPYQTTRTGLVGLDRLKDWKAARGTARLEVEVWTLPKQGAWKTLDSWVGVRVQSPDEFATGFAPWLVAADLLAAAGAYFLIRGAARGTGRSSS